MKRNRFLLEFRFPTTLHSENSIKKKEKTSLPKNRVFGDNLLESFLVSPSSTGLHGSVGLSRLGKTKKMSLFFVSTDPFSSGSLVFHTMKTNLEFIGHIQFRSNKSKWRNDKTFLIDLPQPEQYQNVTKNDICQ